MKTFFRCIIFLLLMVGYCHVNANSNRCSLQMNKMAQAELDSVNSWDDAKGFYIKNKKCLSLTSGSLDYGFNNKLAEMLSYRNGVANFLTSSGRDGVFQVVVRRRVVREYIPLLTLQAIYLNVNNDCPKDASEFCEKISKEIVEVCLACDFGYSSD